MTIHSIECSKCHREAAFLVAIPIAMALLGWLSGGAQQ